MADNTVVNSAEEPGDAIRTEQRGVEEGPKTPVTLIDVGGQAGEALIGDGDNAMPVSGVVTAELSTIDNAVLVAIAAAQLPDGHNVTIDNASVAITAASLPLPSGAFTESTGANRYGGGKTAVVETVITSGDTTLFTPAAGNAIRLFWVSALNDPDQASNPLIKILIGSTELYRTYAVAHWEVFEGAADEVLKINLSEPGSVAFTAHIEEFTP